MRHASNDICVVKLLVGFSAGGRQGLKEAQVNPGDFDGMAWHVAPAC
jgi:hypothetical protein